MNEWMNEYNTSTNNSLEKQMILIIFDVVHK